MLSLLVKAQWKERRDKEEKEGGWDNGEGWMEGTGKRVAIIRGWGKLKG